MCAFVKGRTLYKTKNFKEKFLNVELSCLLYYNSEHTMGQNDRLTELKYRFARNGVIYLIL